MFTTSFKIRSTQVDSFGHLNNAAYLEIYEWARWEWADEDGFDARKLVEKQGIGPAIVHVDLTFMKELRMHDEITVRTWFDSCEKVKACVAQEMIKADGELASTVNITFVMFDLKTRKMIPMPEEIQKLYGLDEEYRRTRVDGRP
jgi:acyl-CoA thioester hydrolase